MEGQAKVSALAGQILQNFRARLDVSSSFTDWKPKMRTPRLSFLKFTLLLLQTNLVDHKSSFTRPFCCYLIFRKRTYCTYTWVMPDLLDEKRGGERYGERERELVGILLLPGTEDDERESPHVWCAYAHTHEYFSTDTYQQSHIKLKGTCKTPPSWELSFLGLKNALVFPWLAHFLHHPIPCGRIGRSEEFAGHGCGKRIFFCFAKAHFGPSINF